MATERALTGAVGAPLHESVAVLRDLLAHGTPLQKEQARRALRELAARGKLNQHVLQLGVRRAT